MDEIIEIDGSFGEGGGQIIRTSLSLAALTGRGLLVTNVRARRSRPGLQPQHLAAVRAAAELCDARLDGAFAGSKSFSFLPQRGVQASSYRFEIGTAGAANLVLQTVLISLSRQKAASEVVVVGGTHVPHSPSAEYVEQVYLPALRLAGLESRYSYPRAGFFPKGGGQLHASVEPSRSLAPLRLVERGKLVSLTAYVVTAELPDHVAERGVAAVTRWARGVGRTLRTEVRRLPSLGAGAAVVLIAECEEGLAGFSAVGERGKPMERVAQEPCDAFMEWWKTGAACDDHLADQLVLPMAFAAGESQWTTPVVTEHLRTVLAVTQKFLPIEYRLDEPTDGPAVVTLRGVG
ncbi:MAG: RNA 3'-terminal phosphate cyclase [Armatimonadota bacterium]